MNFWNENKVRDEMNFKVGSIDQRTKKRTGIYLEMRSCMQKKASRNLKIKGWHLGKKWKEKKKKKSG